MPPTVLPLNYTSLPTISFPFTYLQPSPFRDAIMNGYFLNSTLQVSLELVYVPLAKCGAH